MTMRVQSLVPWLAAVGTLMSWSPQAAAGQGLAFAPRTLRFFYSSSSDGKPVEIDPNHNAVLGRVVSLRMGTASLGGLLAEIQRQTGLTFAYDPHFPATQPIAIEAKAITVAAALGAILVGTGVDVVLTRTGHVWLAESKPGTPSVQEGTIVGRVTDKRMDDPIIGAIVTLDLTRRTATTGSDGRFRIANLVPGSYTIRARYIGYTSLVASTAVSADRETTVDFPLEKSAQPLEQVVVTGTVVPTEVKALPTPVTVVTDSQIALQRPATVMELFRQAVPTGVSFDLTTAPNFAAFSARGASTLSPGATSQLKVFVDGIEVALPSVAGIDPSSIERMEIIRGPQAASIYGTDAIGGVIQVFTKRGDPDFPRPQVTMEGSLGLLQTPYAGFDNVVRQSYLASLRGGRSGLSYGLQTDYARTANWVPNNQSARSNYGASGGVRYSGGRITVDFTGRYDVQNLPSIVSPELGNTGFAFYSRPYYQFSQTTNQTVGAQLGVAATRWWQHTVRAGIDRYTSDLSQDRPRFTTPDDSLLWVINSSLTKSYIAYNTAIEGRLVADFSGSFMAGIDHYHLPQSQFASFGARNTTGAIRPGPGFAVSAFRVMTDNTGYFTQARLGFRDALFLTAGLRGEENTNFGDSLGTPVSPRVGLSYVHQVGGVAVKLRGSWGRAIRAPSPGLKEASASAFSVKLANPNLGPERQRGWDAGVDVVSSKGASLSLTYYDQTAENLIQFVLIEATPLPTSQYQNVGRVRNTGLEVEGGLSLGSAQLKGQYGYARARIEQLAPNYTGDLLIGDQSLGTPKHTAGASFSVLPFRATTISAGLTYVGSWTEYDYLAYYGCLGGAVPCRNDTFAMDRSYFVTYPAFTRVKVSVFQQITPFLTGFTSVDNLTNTNAFEQNNTYPVTGRLTTLGLRFQH